MAADNRRSIPSSLGALAASEAAEKGAADGICCQNSSACFKMTPSPGSQDSGVDAVGLVLTGTLIFRPSLALLEGPSIICAEMDKMRCAARHLAAAASIYYEHKRSQAKNLIP